MSPSATLEFKCALITGGAGGLGRAIAESLIKKDKKVILAGRTEKTLAATSKEIGAAAYYVLDTGDVAEIPAFVEKVLKEHPEVDAIINNAGVQRPFRFPGTERPDKDDYGFDLAKADAEVNINIRGPMHLIIALLPHFQTLAKHGKPSTIMNVSSVLGFSPTSLINPVYNGTKAWVHFFTMNLRSQIKARGPGADKISVIEIAPPSVETALHRERADPDDNKRAKGNKVTLTVEEFMDEVEKGWEEGHETITAGPGHALVEKWFGAYGEGYEKAVSG